jgi:catechol 2,3-dioxygenase-like lactoylglutathione lyase family enzyme
MTSRPDPSPLVRRVLESAPYCDDLSRSRAFDVELLGFIPLLDSPRLLALDAGGGSVLLLFRRGDTAELQTDAGLVPAHGAHGVQHPACAIKADSLRAVRSRLESAGIPLESRVRWALGGESLDCRDPAGHSIEFATPGTWSTY